VVNRGPSKLLCYGNLVHFLCAKMNWDSRFNCQCVILLLKYLIQHLSLEKSHGMDYGGTCKLCDSFDSLRSKCFSTPLLSDNDVKVPFA